MSHMNKKKDIVTGWQAESAELLIDKKKSTIATQFELPI